MNRIRDPFLKTPEGFHNAVENTLDKLEEKEMKKSMKWSALAIAAVLIMLAATGFAAAGLMKGFIDWNGNFTPIESSLNPNPTPAPASAIPQSVTEKMHDLIAPVPDMEYWEVSTEFQSSGRYGAYQPRIGSLDELIRMKEGFDDADIILPGGYEFVAGEMYYTLDHLIGEMYSEEHIDGLILRKYLLNKPNEQDREGYWLNIQNDGGASISLSAFAYPSLEEAMNATGTFYVNEKDEYSLLNIEGVHKALMIKRETGSTDIEIIRVTEDGRSFIYSLYGDESARTEEMLLLIGI